jgi:hypothetical protein
MITTTFTQHDFRITQLFLSQVIVPQLASKVSLDATHQASARLSIANQYVQRAPVVESRATCTGRYARTRNK